MVCEYYKKGSRILDRRPGGVDVKFIGKANALHKGHKENVNFMALHSIINGRAAVPS